MITVTKEDPYILLSNSDCLLGKVAKFKGPVSFDARIERNYGENNLVRIGPVPSFVPDGVYEMRLIWAKQCRYKMVPTLKVNVLMCSPIAFPVKHTPTNPTAGEMIIECCEGK